MVGSAITHKSIPEKEYEESLVKAKVCLRFCRIVDLEQRK